MKSDWYAIRKLAYSWAVNFSLYYKNSKVFWVVNKPKFPISVYLFINVSEKCILLIYL